MGRAFNVLVPASGAGNVPISVSGTTFLTGEGNFEFAYDPADFDSDQFGRYNTAVSNLPLLAFPPNTILWIRLPPADGVPATRLYVHTCISQEDY